mmetsp:Transcript_28492/g.82422  ORF Transcript_28492/g.82422 Transcript_28492/m.82422 type:complete len:436 (+) Transcript_28492:109-1416(+)
MAEQHATPGCHKTDDDPGTGAGDIHRLLLAQLCEPTIVKSFEESGRQGEDGVMLSHIPWTISGTSRSSNERKRRRDDSIPSYSYLDLRLSQNAAWAKAQLQRGVGHARRAQAIQEETHSVTEASAREYRKAEQCYRDGLDLVPSHPELLVTLGALCANLGRDEEAADVLTRAVEVTSENGAETAMGKDSSVDINARKYLNEVMRRLGRAGRNGGGSHFIKADEGGNHTFTKSESIAMQVASKGGEARAEQALRDAMAEQAFLSGDSSALKGVAARKGDGKGSATYGLLEEPPSEDEEELYKMKSNHREDDERYRRRKRKNKNKHRSSHENRHRRKRKSSRKHKKRKRSKRKRRYSSSSSDLESNIVSSREGHLSSDEESRSTDSSSSRSTSTRSKARRHSHKQSQKSRKKRRKKEHRGESSDDAPNNKKQKRKEA